MIETVDPHVLIEEQRVGYVRYRRDDGLRWEVSGICDGRLDCMIGAVVDGIKIKTIEQAQALKKPEFDCPVAPGFRGCCPLKITVL